MTDSYLDRDMQRYTGNNYDFIVIGAGSAGAVLAARLSDSGAHRVLLLEAGGLDNSPWIHIPAGFAKTFVNPRVNWLSQSEPESNLNDRVMYQPRGKVLGGTSSINGMVYMRGNRADYDEWLQRDCEGWGFDSVLPYFRRAEDNERGEDEFHGISGPLHISNPPCSEMADLLLKACVQAGIPYNPDFNGAEQDGAGYYQTTTKSGRRLSTAAAYLRPAQGRSNLSVLTNAHATRVLIEDCKAVGIEFRTPEGLSTAYANGEIIVSAGAFGSPQLLLLSGVGAAQHLQDMGIPVIRNLPGVGANLQEHFHLSCAWRINRPLSMNVLQRSIPHQLVAGLKYMLYRGGPLASSGFYAGAFVRSDPRLARPDLQLHLIAWSGMRRSLKGIIPHPFPTFGISPVHLRPAGRGTVRLKSGDPLVQPEIRFNFLYSEYDIRAVLAGIRVARRIASQNALRDLIVEELLPGPAATTDEQLADDVRNRGVATLHPVGTCAMGHGPDAVVDPRLRVRGIAGLRVVDASIMPSIVAGNTNAPTIMIAEKASDMILADVRATAAQRAAIAGPEL